ncbi:hypothetical protein SDC9_187813 [bioreactor metagenome]|uniref:Uncharacterized protein n=1 Tax=bioreactor metagenome TaxID=1076179 RepID=A0A645HMU6_9ZZZZ
MVYPNEIHLFEAHKISQLHGHKGDGCTLPQSAGSITVKARQVIRRVKVAQILCRLDPLASTPGYKSGDGEVAQVFCTLLDDQIVDGEQHRGCKAKVIEGHVETVHANGELVLEFAQISVLEAGAIANNEAALAHMGVLQGIDLLNRFAPPGMKLTVGPIGQHFKGIAGGA